MVKKICITMVFVMLVGLLGGCGSSTPTPSVSPSPSNQAQQPNDSNPEPDASGNKQIGIVFTSLNNPVFVLMKEKMTEKALEMGYTPIVLDSQEQSEQELRNVEDLISKNVSAICILPVNNEAVINAIKKCNDANIPVVSWNRFVDDQGKCKFEAQVVTDNVTGAVEAGKYAAKLLEGVTDPKVVILRGLTGIDADLERADGFKEGIKGTALENAIVAEQAADFERQKGNTVMENIIQANPKIDLVYALNDEMALGAMQALKGANLTDVKIIGYDGSEDCVAEIKKGTITATVAQMFGTLGSSAVEYAVNAAEGTGSANGEVIYIGTEMVTPENAQTYEFK